MKYDLIHVCGYCAYGLFFCLHPFFTLCESLRHTHVFHPKLKQILNSNPSKRNKSTSFYRGRSLVVASLSGGLGVHVHVHVHVHAGCFDLSLGINFERLPCNCKHLGPLHITPEQFKKGVLALVSLTGQNYWMQISWDRVPFTLNLEGTFGNKEGMITWCWLAKRAHISH